MLTRSDTKNAAGGKAYKMSTEGALAQMAATGTLNDQFYESGETQLKKVLELAANCSSEYIAKCAVFARQRGFMKDMPALLLGILAGRKDVEAQHMLELAFPRVVDNGKMLRNFVQIIRSGVCGRKSLGTQPRRLVANWLLSRSPDDVFRNSVGDKPSMADVIRLGRPKPTTPEQSALFAYLIGREHNANDLPGSVQQLMDWRRNPEGYIMPKVPWEMLTSSELSPAHWAQIARNASWTQLRMNLNTFQRHGVWDNPQAVDAAAKKLSNADEVRRSRCFPFQLLAAFTYATDVPMPLRLALQDAMEVACENIPEIPGRLHIYVDVSGSMQSPVTGARGSATSKVSCTEAAALIAAALMRKNPNAVVIPFSDRPHKAAVNPRDSIMTNARKLAIGGGGTNCAIPFQIALTRPDILPDVAVLISDNQSWIDTCDYQQRTGALTHWLKIKRANKSAKLICIDLQTNATTQVKGEGVLNIGGFSDAVFEAMANFASNQLLTDPDWAATVNEVVLST